MVFLGSWGSMLNPHLVELLGDIWGLYLGCLVILLLSMSFSFFFGGGGGGGSHVSCLTSVHGRSMGLLILICNVRVCSVLV